MRNWQKRNTPSQPRVRLRERSPSRALPRRQQNFIESELLKQIFNRHCVISKKTANDVAMVAAVGLGGLLPISGTKTNANTYMCISNLCFSNLGFDQKESKASLFLTLPMIIFRNCSLIVKSEKQLTDGPH